MAARNPFLVAAFSFAGVLVAAPALAQEPAPAIVASAPAISAWSEAGARDLLDAIAAARDEGLDPAAYDTVAVRDALAAHDTAALAVAADAAALSLARDYFQGRVADKAAFDWHIERSPYEAYALRDELRQAVATGTLRPWLASLLPQNDDYRTLRTALADAPDARLAGRIRANMERWRWMPRTLGSNYLYVNVPSYKLQVMQGGAEVASYDVVVGAADTPTPVLALTAASVVVNPWWNVPESIAKKGLGRGYEAVRNADGSVRYRQAPGPGNALGRIKIDMPNDQAIYLHDTPAKAGFAKADRALSHGCIRVKDIDLLAAELMDADADRSRLDEALAGAETATLRLQARWPVYLVYFTMAADGGKLRPLADPYRRDEALAARLTQTTLAATARPATAAAVELAGR